MHKNIRTILDNHSGKIFLYIDIMNEEKENIMKKLNYDFIKDLRFERKPLYLFQFTRKSCHNHLHPFLDGNHNLKLSID